MSLLEDGASATGATGVIRGAVVAAAIAAITLALIPLQWLSVQLRAPTQRGIPVLYHRVLCSLLGIKIRVIGERLRGQGLLVVANHSSWLDVPVITAVAPVVFVAKREVASWPLFGLLAKLQRSVFVDRQRRHQTGEVTTQIAGRLAEGDAVVLFGEGTSSDGNRVLPFRTALLGAAGEALAAAGPGTRVMLQPLSVAYVGFDSVAMGRHQRPAAAWYGEMDLLPHLWGVLKRGAVDVVLSWGDPLPFDAASDRKQVARELQASVHRLTVRALRTGPLSPRPPHSFLPPKALGRRHRAQGIAPRPFS